MKSLRCVKQLIRKRIPRRTMLLLRCKMLESQNYLIATASSASSVSSSEGVNTWVLIRQRISLWHEELVDKQQYALFYRFSVAGAGSLAAQYILRKMDTQNKGNSFPCHSNIKQTVFINSKHVLIVVLYHKYLYENNNIDGNFFFLFLTRAKKESQATHINLLSSLTGNPIGKLWVIIRIISCTTVCNQSAIQT